ncbi:MAG: nucleoside triphosphate pyrophosphohydrolase [Hyphomicrobiaceae bacterium]
MTRRAPRLSPSRDITRLVEVMTELRTPGTGCPWDLEQTFETIAPYTVEEAYEVADAIARQDLADLRDELGDLLLQVVYHAQLAREAGAFDFGDVVHAITRKMIRRHPHVFGDLKHASTAEAEANWERIKAEERAEKRAERERLARQSPGDTGADTGTAAPSGRPEARSGLLSGVSVALPALSHALKLQDKAAAVGFDWPSLAPVFEKMREELAELEAVARPNDPRGPAAPHDAGDNTPGRALRRREIQEELGDLLFVIANVSRHLDIDAEAALQGACTKFRRRFSRIESKLSDRGKTPEQSSLEEMDRLWDEAKTEERA